MSQLLSEVLVDMLQNAQRANHATVWLADCEDAFVFMTWDKETMAAAHKVLDEAGLLCNMVIGKVKP